MKYKMETKSKKLVRDLNPYITCQLCGGYFVDATTLVECIHTFCRGCILRHFESNKTICPVCNTTYKKKSTCLKPDPQIQSLVYKVVPGLYSKELQRREDFYRTTDVRASSSCSDDSVIERERNMLSLYEDDQNTPEEFRKTEFFSPEDLISLSLEYYQTHLDKTEAKRRKSLSTDLNSEQKTIEGNSAGDSDSTKPETKSDVQSNDNKDVLHKTNGASDSDTRILANQVSDENKKEEVKDKKDCDKRYLQCPAAVSMKHLQKFIRLKYGLTGDHRVDIIYEGEVLPDCNSLMDVAYIFKWSRTKPMRFFYRIFTPMKVRPIKIVNTLSPTGAKQLQIVPVKSESKSSEKIELKKSPKAVSPLTVQRDYEKEEDERRTNKETLFAHLQLQSKSKTIAYQESKKAQLTFSMKDKDLEKKEKSKIQDCVFDYNETDEEIKKFAEKRDREWALQKKLDESRSPKDNESYHHYSKKRKRNKHSKSDFVHKKRKLHAEITSNEEEDLKLKVKLTHNNGHKHKHHKSSSSIDKNSNTELSNKEKLLQMRQVRHKPIPEDKMISAVPSTTIKIPKSVVEKSVGTDPPPETNIQENSKETNTEEIQIKKEESTIDKVKAPVINENNGTTSSKQKQTVRAETSNKTVSLSTNTPWGLTKKVATVQLERNIETERQAQNTFLKTFPAYADKCQSQKNSEAVVSNQKDTQKISKSGPINTNNKSLDQKLANLQQRCTIEPKFSTSTSNNLTKSDKKINFEKTTILNSGYPAGFTVSKIEQGVKRKSNEETDFQEKRPSLEITLIEPPVPSPPSNTNRISSPSLNKNNEKPVAKRMSPATIPLDRIKKSVNLKSGISIIPKMTSEKCDNIGALDLSKHSNKTDKADTPNGIKQMNNSRNTPDVKNNIQLSNLQMLSKVATEHNIINNKVITQTSQNNKARPQSLGMQTLKIPNMQNMGFKTIGLQKPLKLNELQKFRMSGPPQIRNMRPNQNQSIRNIPNPSLLIRQQNQNRMNCMNAQQNSSEKSSAESSKVLNNGSQKDVPVGQIKTSSSVGMSEKSEISV